MVNEANVLVSDRGRDGGNRLWAHCEICRQATSPWDDEYIHLATMIAAFILSSPRVGEREGISGLLATAQPGRFARAAMCGMTALTEGLVDTNPDLVIAVRTGTPLSSFGDLRLLAAVTPGVERAYIGGGHRGAFTTICSDGSTRPKLRPTLSGVIHFPPFSLLLAPQEVAVDYPHVDITSWLGFGVDEEVEGFPLRLPAVRLKDGVEIVAEPSAFEPVII